MATPFDGLPESLREVVAAVNEMTGALSQAGTAANFAFNELGNFASAVTSTVGKFVSAFNVATVELFTTAVRDMSAALGSILTPVMIRFREIVVSLNTVITSMNPQAKLLVASLAGAAVGTVVLTGVVQGLAIAINSATAGIPALLGAVAGAASGVALMSGTMDEFRGVVARIADSARPILDALGIAFQRVFDAAQPVLESMLRLGEQFQGQFVAVINQAAGVVASFVSNLLPLAAQVLPTVVQLASAFQQLNVGVVSIVAGVAGPLLGLLAAFAPVVQALLLPATTVMKVVGAIGSLFGSVLGPAMELVTVPLKLLSSLWSAVANELQGALNELTGAFAAVTATVGELVRAFVDALKELAEPFREFLQGVVVGAVRVFTDALKSLADWVRSVVREVREFFGLPTLGGGPNRRTEGMRNVSEKSPAQMAFDLQKASFGIGMDPPRQTAQNTKTMVQLLENLPGEIAAKLAEILQRQAQRVGEAGGNTAAGVAGHGVFGIAWPAVRAQMARLTR